MSRLIETIRLQDGRLMNLDYHQRRLEYSLASLFSISENWNLEKILAQVSLPRNGLFKCRFLYSNNDYKIDCEPYTIRPVRSLKIIQSGISYPFKFEDRTSLIKIYNQKEKCDDVLIIKSGKVTDTSYANIIFRKMDRWFTPATFLLPGTMREYLLDQSQIEEMEIRVEDLKKFSSFKLINAMLQWESPEVDISNIV